MLIQQHTPEVNQLRELFRVQIALEVLSPVVTSETIPHRSAVDRASENVGDNAGRNLHHRESIEPPVPPEKGFSSITDLPVDKAIER